MPPWQTIRQCGGTQGDLKWASPERVAESDTGSLSVSSPHQESPAHLPPSTAWMASGSWVSLPWEEIKGNECLGKDSPAICTTGNALWKAKEKDPSPCMLLGEWCNLQQLPPLPHFIPVPLTQIQTCLSPPTSPRVLWPRGMNSPPPPVNFSE